MASCLFLSLAKLLDFSSSSVRFVVNSDILSSNSFFSCRIEKAVSKQLLELQEIFPELTVLRDVNIMSAYSCYKETWNKRNPFGITDNIQINYYLKICI